MGFTLRTYYLKKRKNSTKQPTSADIAATYTNCTLKNNTSIVNPVFLLKDGTNALPLGRYVAAQYDTGLTYYYWIDTFVSVATGLWELHCTMDVLATWKEDIGNTEVLIERCADAGLVKTIDSLYLTSYDGSLYNNEYNSVIDWASEYADATFALAIITNDSQSTFSDLSSTTYYTNYAGLKAFLSELADISSSDSASFIKTREFFANAFGDVYGCIQAVSCIPVKFDSRFVSAGTVKIVNYTVQTQLYGVPYTRYVSGDTSVSFTYSASYVDYAPFASHFLTLPFIGNVTVGDECLGGTLTVREMLDIKSGAYCIKLYKDNSLINQFYADTSVRVNVNQRVYNEDNKTFNAVNGVVSGLFSLNMDKMIDSTASALASSDKINVSGGANSQMYGMYANEGKIIAHTYKRSILNASASKHIGKIYGMVDLIKNHSGYIKCAHAHVYGTGLDVRDTIDAFLNGGFYYE